MLLLELLFFLQHLRLGLDVLADWDVTGGRLFAEVAQAVRALVLRVH